MKNMERENFEESWRDAFEKAEISPSEKVWTNIELDLEKEKGGNLKKRLVFYQMLAAASVVFAIGMGALGWYYNFSTQYPTGNNLTLDTQPSSEIAAPAPATEKGDQLSPLAGVEGSETPSTIRENTTIPENTSTENANPGPTSTHDIAVTEGDAHPGRNNTLASLSTGTGSEVVANSVREKDNFIVAGQNEEALAGLSHSLDDRALTPLYTPRHVQLRIPSQKTPVVDPVQTMMARLEQREREVQGEQKNKKEKSGNNENLWTSIGFAAGSFNSLQPSSPTPAPTATTAMALAAPIVDQETKGSGFSYTMGVNVGTKLSERWVLQGGVNYLTHASEYTANNVVVSNSGFQQLRFRAASTNELINADAKDLSNKLVYSAPYNVNNSMRYLSIPLQAGYLLVNKTIGVQLNAGVATDLFLQNTVTADSDQLDKTTQSGGSDSPYRSVNLSGLLGTEVSYRFGEHYRVSLNPGLRYPFSTIYKTELGVQATPLTFDVGLRFRYIFR